MAADIRKVRVMEYRVLARRFRPRRFGDLIGQDVVIRTLKNALRKGQLAHAYLLCGIRGVGKTTIARLLAMAVNCEHPAEGEPCGECPACVSILEGSNLEVQEMDAASHTGVDDIREILDSVRYPPTTLDRKVYIIDEAHMLSKSAFNALLKTLEEPPDRVLFILATTEVEKLPVTVRSRCQRFDLRRLGVEEIRHYLARILDREQTAYEAGAVHRIALAADGSVRDALSLAERVLSYAGDTLNEEAVRHALGLAPPEAIRSLSEAVFRGDSRQAVEALRTVVTDGHAPRGVLLHLAELWHDLACLMVDRDLLEGEVMEERRRWLQEWAPCLDARGLDVRYQVLLHGLRDLEVVDERMGAEMLVIRLAGLLDLYPLLEVPTHVPDQPPPADAGGDASTRKEPAPPQRDGTDLVGGERPDAPGHKCRNWEEAVEAYAGVRAGVAAMLEHVLCLDFGSRVRVALDEHQQRALGTGERLAFAEWLGREVHWEPREGREGESLSQQRRREAERRNRRLEEAVREDPHVQRLMQRFDADIESVHVPGAATDTETTTGEQT